MTTSASLLAHWYFHLPNLIIATLIYALIAQGILSLAINGQTLAMRVLGWLTAPVLTAVGTITPRFIPARLLFVPAVVWLLMVRTALLFGVTLAGVRPALG